MRTNNDRLLKEPRSRSTEQHPLAVAALLLAVTAICFALGLFVVGPRIKNVKPGVQQPTNQPEETSRETATTPNPGSVEVVELPPISRPRVRQTRVTETSEPPRQPEVPKPTPQREHPSETSAWSLPEEQPQIENTEPAPPQPANRTYRVQAGVFENPDNAQALSNRLAENGFTPDITTHKDGGRVLYRVQVGAFADRASADAMAERLRSKGFEAMVSEE